MLTLLTISGSRWEKRPEALEIKGVQYLMPVSNGALPVPSRKLGEIMDCLKNTTWKTKVGKAEAEAHRKSRRDRSDEEFEPRLDRFI